MGKWEINVVVVSRVAFYLAAINSDRKPVWPLVYFFSKNENILTKKVRNVYRGRGNVGEIKC